MKARTTNLRLLVLLLLLGWGAMSFAQGGWERVLTEYENNSATNVVEMANGSLITMLNLGGQDGNIHLHTFDADGDFLGSQSVFKDVYGRKGYTFSLLPDASLFIAGQVKEEEGDENKLFGMKVTPNGEIIWEERFDLNGIVTNGHIKGIHNVDGFIIAADVLTDVPTGIVRPTLFRISADGVAQWSSKPLVDSINVWFEDIAFAPDGGIFMISEDHLFSSQNSSLYKININGELVNEIDLSLDNNSMRQVNELQEVQDSGIILFSSIYTSQGNDKDDYFILYKYNDNLELMWENEFEHINLSEYFQSGIGRSTSCNMAMSNMDSLYLLINFNRYNTGNDTTLHRRYIYKIDATGNVQYKNVKPLDNHFEFHNRLIVGQNSNLISSGYKSTGTTPFNGINLPHLVKYDSQGNTLFNQLKGTVYIDDNNDCSLSLTEEPINGWQVIAYDDNQLYTSTTDDNGNYNIDIGLGDYQVFTTPTSEYWNICNGSVNLEFVNSFDTITQNFGAQAMVDCPDMWVDLAAPFLRNCVDNTYHISYCNYGTIDASDSYIEITLDEGMNIENATLPFTFNVDSNVIFDLGMVAVLECGDFSFDVSLDCDSTEIGQTLCVEAAIFPDSICTPSPNWSGASIAISGECIEEDSIFYKIENVGNAPTSTDLKYIVIEDHVIMSQGTVNLNPAEIFELSVAANGSTYRLEVEQEAFHPGVSFPSLSIEGCGGLTPGLINSYYLDDGNLHTDIDCKEIIGSYDPNDKRGYPLGYDSENYIDKNTDLEYLIRFQNVGNDTAFRVVIRDTLSPLLDASSVRPGSSSHPYSFSLTGNGILKFVFEDIELPDSTTDLSGSNGFVEFKIKQSPDNQIGDVILARYL